MNPHDIPNPPARKRAGKSILKKNTGKDWESLLALIFEGYEKRGIAKIRKVDPPSKVIRRGPKVVNVILLENPWLDFAGSWTEMGGRQLILEAKSTEEPRLEINEKALTPTQVDNLLDWHRHGSAIGVLWHHQGEVKVITAETLQMARSMKIKSFKWRHLPHTPRGEGLVIWDILDVIASTK